MECRVNPSSRYGTIVAFSGHEYVKYEWRPVPAGCEAEAERHPYLEIKPNEPEPVITTTSSEGYVFVDGSTDAPPQVVSVFEAEQPPENAEPQPAPKPEKEEPKSSRRRK